MKMEDSIDFPEISLKQLCCTCLSKNRKLFQLCKLYEGVNSLYSLLSYDTEAYREGFYKDTSNLYICWECNAIMKKFNRFRRQACVAQKQLSNIADGRSDVRFLKTCLSHLSHHYKTTYDETVKSDTEADAQLDADNFIDCGPDVDGIKTESDLDDIPLSELPNNYSINIDVKDVSEVKSEKPCKEVNRRKKKVKKKTKPDGNSKYYITIEMNEAEMLEAREKSKLNVSYADAPYKCETCIEGYKTQRDLDTHNLDVHTEKENHLQCDLCLSYLTTGSLTAHITSHYQRFICRLCEYCSYNLQDMLKHLTKGHSVIDVMIPGVKRKSERETRTVLNPGSKPRRNESMLDKRTPYGYLCTECNKYFDNKNQRWKHIQRHHREGFKCETCGKRFAFKNNLNRHEQLHQAPPPREECPVCHKMIRVDLVKVHSRIHSNREQFSCEECEKRFVSRASYEHHLKYTQAHAAVDILKHKCSMCDKGYRSRGELRDHVNYQHMGKTRHKCPICGKALATRRCITRHVRRAHDGVKESARDKICQQCGKAFRDKKGLREHEFIHTGERPLSCEICGCTFRQSASLYTHRKRVHKIYPQRKNVQLLDPE